MNKQQPLLELKGLEKVYSRNSRTNPFQKQYIRAVRGLDLAIYPGETFGLVGESGCGKSTTGHMIAELVSPTGGTVAYCGQERGSMSRETRKEMRRDIQIVMQDPYASLNPKHKIGRIIQEPLIIHRRGTRKERTAMVAEAMETVGLDESYAARYPHELSGGQRQRVSIATALMLNPCLLVADEVVSALDVSIQAQILNLLKKLQKTKNLTYLFISHDLNVVQYMSDRIGVMYLGQLVEVGSVEDVYGHPAHPYTQALLSTMPTLESQKQKRIVLHGEVPSLLNLPSGCAFHTRCRYATEACRQKSIPMQAIGGGHAVRCWRVQNKAGELI